MMILNGNKKLEKNASTTSQLANESAYHLGK